MMTQFFAVLTFCKVIPTVILVTKKVKLVSG